MATFYKFAAATVLGVSCGAWAGVTPIPDNIPAVHIGADADAMFVSANHRLDGSDLLGTVPPGSPASVATGNNSGLPAKHPAGPTVVPLPAAAPAGLLMLGLIGFVGLVRRLRSKVATPA